MSTKDIEEYRRISGRFEKLRAPEWIIFKHGAGHEYDFARNEDPAIVVGGLESLESELGTTDLSQFGGGGFDFANYYADVAIADEDYPFNIADAMI